MSVVINPYLNFNGTCEEAFNLYKSVFGGEFAFVMRFGDTDTGQPVADEDKNKVMHVALPIGRGNMLMGSDCPSYMELKQGNNYFVSVTTESEAQSDEFFAKLSDGGQATMPMGKMFWGSYFGMCTDKFGTQWMISFDYNNSPQPD
jgi:PhnB protein